MGHFCDFLSRSRLARGTTMQDSPAISVLVPVVPQTSVPVPVPHTTHSHNFYSKTWQHSPNLASRDHAGLASRRIPGQRACRILSRSRLSHSFESRDWDWDPDKSPDNRQSLLLVEQIPIENFWFRNSVSDSTSKIHFDQSCLSMNYIICFRFLS